MSLPSSTEGPLLGQEIPFSDSSNITIQTCLNPQGYATTNLELVNKIDDLQKSALQLISKEIKGNTNVLAIRVKDSNLNKEIAHLYATGIGTIFSLEFLCVKKTCRNSGLGSILYNLAFQHALDIGMTKIKLCTYDFQAPKFYLKQGFTQTAKLPNALEGYSLNFFEKELSAKDFLVIDDVPNQWQFEIFTDNNFYLPNLYNEPKSEIRNIIDKSIACLAKYNLGFLSSQDNLKREYRQFAISSTDNKTGGIIFVISGGILSGGINGATMIPDTFAIASDYEMNEDEKQKLHRSILDVAKENGCTGISPYDQDIELNLEKLGFYPHDTIPLRKIEYT